MPMCRPVLALALVGGSIFGLTQVARAFDGTKTPNNLSPIEAFQSALKADQSGDKKTAISALEFAASKGHAIAQWKLGRMYAEGDGVGEDDLKAFDYFSQIANMHAEDNPRTVEARFVANAFVALGNYYLEGIPNSRIKADPNRAHAMFTYAATYFGDPDAQYNLARIYLDGAASVAKDPRQAARWLGLAANKGQREAQALLGHLLFVGKDVPRQGARGLMWLTLARDAAGPKDRWILDLYDKAYKAASPDDRSMAETYVAQWMKGRS
jgi:TPR repeat protein